MPLPFAPKPDESKVYQSLKSTLLSDVTPVQLDDLRDDVFAQGVDGAEDEYRRLVLLMLAAQAGSVSGPIPGTMKLFNADYDGTGNNFIDIAENPGEVWVLNSLSMAEQGSGTATITFAIYEPASGDQSVFAIGSTTSQEQVAIDTLTPIYFGYGFQMNALVNNTGGTSVHIDLTAIRVR